MDIIPYSNIIMDAAEASHSSSSINDMFKKTFGFVHTSVGKTIKSTEKFRSQCLCEPVESNSIQTITI